MVTAFCWTCATAQPTRRYPASRSSGPWPRSTTRSRRARSCSCGEIGTPGYFQRFRGVSGEATAYLVERGVRVIGVDSFGFDAPFLRMLDEYNRTGDQARLWPAHLHGREHEYCHIERLTNLGAIGRPLGFQVSCFPIKLTGGDAGWSRVVAWVSP
jgi:kynurenine formamidase